MRGVAARRGLRHGPAARRAADRVGHRRQRGSDLGLDDSDLLPQVELTQLPGERHLLRLSGLNTRRSATRNIHREIVFDDEVYRAGERVDSTLDFTMFGLTYGRRLIVHERGELAVTVGVQVAELKANAVVRSRVVREAEGGTAPLPLVGAEGRYDFTQRWSAEARAQYLSVGIDDVDGSILYARAAATWRMNPYLLFGLGYRYFNLDVRSRDLDTSGYVDMTLNGPLLFVRASLWRPDATSEVQDHRLPASWPAGQSAQACLPNRR